MTTCISPYKYGTFYSTISRYSEPFVLDFIKQCYEAMFAFLIVVSASWTINNMYGYIILSVNAYYWSNNLCNNYLFVFRSNLELVRELGDRPAQGRACGNLGNTHYLLGNFKQAINYHEDVSICGTQWKQYSIIRIRNVYFF